MVTSCYFYGHKLLFLWSQAGMRSRIFYSTPTPDSDSDSQTYSTPTPDSDSDSQTYSTPTPDSDSGIYTYSTPTPTPKLEKIRLLSTPNSDSDSASLVTSCYYYEMWGLFVVVYQNLVSCLTLCRLHSYSSDELLRMADLSYDCLHLFYLVNFDLFLCRQENPTSWDQ